MRDHIHGIQIIRFFAAAMVLFGHITHELNERPQFSDKHNDLLSPFFMAGGVDIFFVISGFIIFLVGHEQFAKPGAPARFIQQRLIRIVPLYWLLTAAMIASIALFSNQVVHSDISLPLTLASFAFFPIENSYGHFYPVLMVGWTLNFELLFYGVFSLALFLPRRHALPLIAGILLMLGLAGYSGANLPGPLAFWADPIVWEFLLGMGLAKLRLMHVRWSARTGWLIFAGGVALLAALYQTGIAGANWDLRILWMGLPAAIICAGPALAISRAPHSKLEKLLGQGGDISYALYLSHPFVIGVVALVFSQAEWNNVWIFTALCVTLSIAGAACIHTWLDTPMRHWLKTMTHRPGLERHPGPTALRHG